MNISEKILENLKKTGAVTVPGFGLFSLEYSKAELIEEHNTILPPAKHIVFSSDYQSVNPGFVQQISHSSSIPVYEAEASLKAQTDYWKKLISEGESFEIPELGSFKLIGENLAFNGKRIEQDDPDFYGLEEINISEIKNTSRLKPYKTNKAAVWAGILFSAASLGAAAYFGRDTPFGKNSFGGETLKKTTEPAKTAEPIPAAKIGSLKTDSIKEDSAKKASTVKKATGIKKAGMLRKTGTKKRYAQKKYTARKKYTKNKWNKQRKRQTR